MANPWDVARGRAREVVDALLTAVERRELPHHVDSSVSRHVTLPDGRECFFVVHRSPFAPTPPPAPGAQ